MGMPTPKQLPSGARPTTGKWQGAISTRDSKDVALSDARAMRAGKLEEAKRAKEKMTLTDAITAYIDNRRNVLSPSTIRGYKIIQKNRMSSLMKRQVHEITLEDIQSAVNEEAKTRSTKIIRNTVGLVLSVLSDYKELNTKKLKYLQKIKAEHKFMDTEDIVKLVEGCKGDKTEIPILLAVWLGLRKSEIFGLHRESIDFAEKKIKIERSVVMDADGVPLVIVSGQLGHAKASTTANIYGHVIASAQAKSLQTFDKFSDVVAPATMPLEFDVLKQQTTDKRQNRKKAPPA